MYQSAQAQYNPQQEDQTNQAMPVFGPTLTVLGRRVIDEYDVANYAQITIEEQFPVHLGPAGI